MVRFCTRFNDNNKVFCKDAVYYFIQTYNTQSIFSEEGRIWSILCCKDCAKKETCPHSCQRELSECPSVVKLTLEELVLELL